MAEENLEKSEEKGAEQTQPEPSFLDTIKAEREALEKVRDENKQLLAEIKEIKAQEMISGKTDAGQPQQPQLSKEEQESRDRIKEIGMATGAKWAKDM